MDTRDAEAAKERAAPGLMAIPGVCGVGVTELAGRPAILVLVTRSTPELRSALPQEVEGFPVVVHDTGGGVRPLRPS